jgi:hypothetical protein
MKTPELVAFTPGPWKIGHAGFDRTPYINARVDGSPKCVARLPVKQGLDHEANACLIRSAPELYAVLFELRKLAPLSKDQCILVDAVLAKARG